MNTVNLLAFQSFAVWSALRQLRQLRAFVSGGLSGARTIQLSFHSCVDVCFAEYALRQLRAE